MYSFFKRFADIILSSAALLVLMPLLIPITIILRFTGEREIFYFQNRVGLSMETIRIIKFATMLKDSESMGSGIYTSKEDSRILPFGNLLRKTKINELPQLLNILLGDMSIVGPRPLIRETFELYDEHDQSLISSVKPGLTGIGSIIFRSEDELLARSDLPLEEFYKKHITPYKAELESWYINNRSLIMDTKIIILTALVIIFTKKDFSEKFFKDIPPNNFENI